jgi:hypothetical protein
MNEVLAWYQWREQQLSEQGTDRKRSRIQMEEIIAETKEKQHRNWQSL